VDADDSVEIDGDIEAFMAAFERGDLAQRYDEGRAQAIARLATYGDPQDPADLSWLE
jgi:hypothetical protein